MVRNRASARVLTYFGNNFISQMVEEAIRGTSTLDLILTKKKNIVGEMKIDRNIQRELLGHFGVEGIQRGSGGLPNIQSKEARLSGMRLRRKNGVRRWSSFHMCNCNCNPNDPLRKKRGVTIKRPKWLHEEELSRGQILTGHVRKDGKGACHEGL